MAPIARRFPPIALASALLCAACVEKAAQTPAPLPPPPPQAAYRLQVGDQLAIRLIDTPELNEDIAIRPDGRITTQLAAGIPAAGRTPEQLAEALRAPYAVELKDPRIAVEVKSYAPLRVYVAGEVNQPGEFASPGAPPTLLQAVSRAGGVRISGDARRILIVRRGEDGRPLVYGADWREVAAGRAPDPVLAPFDVVVVPKTGIAEVYAWVNQHIQQFVPVSWGFSYNVSPVVSGLRR